MELPAELVVKIGTYTDGKTINSMSRASRRFNGIVESNRMTLPKCAVNLYAYYEKENKLINFTVKIWPTDEGTINYDDFPKRVFVAKLLEKDSNETEEQKRNLVAQFYEENAESHLYSTEQTFSFGFSSGLELHLDCIMRKVHFNIISLDFLNIEHHSVVFRQLQWYRPKVYHLSLFPNAALPMGVILPTNIVKTMIIWSPSEGFYQLPSTRQLSYLNVFDCREKLDDDAFCQLRAAEMYIENGVSQISVRGIRTFITQWCECERAIESVTLGTKEVVADEEAEREKWLQMAESLDAELVRVGDEADRVGIEDLDSESTTMVLVRLSDGEKLIFEWTYGSLTLSSLGGRVVSLF